MLPCAHPGGTMLTAAAGHAAWCRMDARNWLLSFEPDRPSVFIIYFTCSAAQHPTPRRHVPSSFLGPVGKLFVAPVFIVVVFLPWKAELFADRAVRGARDGGEAGDEGWREAVHVCFRA